MYGHTKKISLILASIILLFAIVPMGIICNAVEAFQMTAMPLVSLAPNEVPIQKNQISVGSDNTQLHASENSYNPNGASVINGLSAYSGTTVEGIRNEPAKDFYRNAAGIDVSAVGLSTWGDIFGKTPNEIKALIEQYNITSPQPYNAQALASPLNSIQFSTQSSGENPVEQMVDFSLNLVMSAVTSNVPEYSGLINMVNNSTSMSDLFTDPVQNVLLVTALSATSGTSPGEVNDTPIENLLVDSLNNIDPKKSGEEYTDIIDILVYKLEDDCNTQITRTTSIDECVGKIIRAEGDFVPRTDGQSQPTVFWFDGEPDSQRTLKINIEWPEYNLLKDNIYITFDNEPINTANVELTEDMLTGESTLILSDVFSNEGVHSIFINIFGSPMYFYLDLKKVPEPISDTTVKTDPGTSTIGNENTTTDASKAGSIKTGPNIPKTGSKVLPCALFVTAGCITAVIAISRKREE